MSEVFVIRWEVDEVSKLTNTLRHSPIHHHSGLPWSLCARKHTADGPVDYFSLFLDCNDDSIYDYWSCEHKSTIVVVNRNDETKTAKHEVNNKYTKDNTSWGRRQLVHFVDLLDIQKGFILDDKIIVEGHVTVKKVDGIKKVNHYDFSQKGRDTIALSIAGENMFVSKGFLATESPFFANLFSKGNYGNEDNAKENIREEKAQCELDDVSVQDFTELLLATYPSNKAITVESYTSILTLAHRFQVQRAMDKAETYLMKTNKVTVSEKLLLSENYKLDLLQLHCLNSLATPEAVKALEKTEEYKEFSKELKVTLFDRVLELVK